MSSGPRPRSKPRLALSLLLGIALIPLSAVAAFVLTERSPVQASETAESDVVPVQQATTPTIPEFVYSDVEATTEDLEYACGEGGLALVAAESDGSITDLQKSALDALRAICESLGMALPGKEAPPPIVETRTVTVQRGAPPPPPPPAPAAAPTTTSATSQSEQEETHSAETEEQRATTVSGTASGATPTTAAMGTAERYEAVLKQALAEIAHAVEEGGSAEKIAEANKKLEEAQRAAAAGKYEEATTQAYEAIGKAREALGEEED